MHIKLPHSVAAYLDAENAHLPDAVAACFTVNAAVRDEGRTLEGRAAIRDWKAATSAKYKPTITPQSAEQLGERCTVHAVVSGNFPGSPIDLRFHFTLESGLISALEISA